MPAKLTPETGLANARAVYDDLVVPYCLEKEIEPPEFLGYVPIPHPRGSCVQLGLRLKCACCGKVVDVRAGNIKQRIKKGSWLGMCNNCSSAVGTEAASKTNRKTSADQWWWMGEINHRRVKQIKNGQLPIVWHRCWRDPTSNGGMGMWVADFYCRNCRSPHTSSISDAARDSFQGLCGDCNSLLKRFRWSVGKPLGIGLNAEDLESIRRLQGKVVGSFYFVASKWGWDKIGISSDPTASSRIAEFHTNHYLEKTLFVAESICMIDAILHEHSLKTGPMYQRHGVYIPGVEGGTECFHYRAREKLLASMHRHWN